MKYFHTFATNRRFGECRTVTHASFSLSLSSPLPPPSPMSTTIAPARPAHRHLDFLKPRRGVAIVRLKNNGLGAVVFFVVTLLAPGVPSPLNAFWTVFLSQSGAGTLSRGGKPKGTGTVTGGATWAVSVVGASITLWPGIHLR